MFYVTLLGLALGAAVIASHLSARKHARRAARLSAAIGARITCPKCGMTSYNPNDIRTGYCGNCHEWTSPPLSGSGLH